jgi:hypothetical protein
MYSKINIQYKIWQVYLPLFYKGLCNLTFPSNVRKTVNSNVPSYLNDINAAKSNIDAWIKLTNEVLDNYFNKSRVSIYHRWIYHRGLIFRRKFGMLC